MKLKNSLTKEEIETIAHTLLTLEAVLINVGIPFLPQNKIRQELKKNYFSPAEDFIKCSLVTVTTPSLLESIKILGQISHDEKSEDELFKLLKLKNISDVLFFPLLTSIGIFSVVISMILPNSPNLTSAVLSAFVSAFGGFVSAFFTTTKQYRHLSFKKVLEMELKRRQGRFGSFPTRKLPISSLSMSDIKKENLPC